MYHGGLTRLVSEWPVIQEPYSVKILDGENRIVGKVRLISSAGHEPYLLAQTFDDYFGRQPDHEALAHAMSATPGAKLGELCNEASNDSSTCDGWTVAITLENIRALWRSGYQWDLQATEEAVRYLTKLRAHEIYERRGRSHGFALDDWLEAEQEVERLVAEWRTRWSAEERGR